MDPSARPDNELDARLLELGTSLAAREASHSDALERAWQGARRLHDEIAAGLRAFQSGLERGGYTRLRVELSPPRLDAKHAHAVELELCRGRHRAIVTVKSKGEVTLVGPFRSGKTEGPCRSFPLAADRTPDTEFESALANFLVSFLEAAAAP